MPFGSRRRGAYLHFPAQDRRALLRELAFAVRPGGTLFVIGHDVSNLDAGSGGPQDPAILFRPDGITDDLAELPLQISRAERVQRTFLDANGEVVAIDALVVATTSHP